MEKFLIVLTIVVGLTAIIQFVWSLQDRRKRKKEEQQKEMEKRCDRDHSSILTDMILKDIIDEE